MYIRKTIDIYNILTNYGNGYNIECIEYNLQQAKKTKREYINNAKGLINVKIEKKRVNIN